MWTMAEWIQFVSIRLHPELVGTLAWLCHASGHDNHLILPNKFIYNNIFKLSTSQRN